VRDATDRANSSLNLAVDDGERRAAITYTKGRIDYAAGVGARFVVLHLGGVGNAMFEDERELRRLYDSGTREGERVEALRAAILAHASAS